MAKKPTTAAAPVVAIDMMLLAQIVAATQGNSFVYTTTAQNAALVAKGYVEVNAQMANPDGSGGVATRALPAGMQAVIASQPTTPAAAAPAPTSAPSLFTVKMAAPIAASSFGAGRGGKAIYPFDQLAAPVKDANGMVTAMASFFVPATIERPNPSKALASTVSSATKRANKDPAVVGPRYAIRAIEDAAQWGQSGVKGAAIYRIT